MTFAFASGVKSVLPVVLSVTLAVYSFVNVMYSDWTGVEYAIFSPPAARMEPRVAASGTCLLSRLVSTSVSVGPSTNCNTARRIIMMQKITKVLKKNILMRRGMVFLPTFSSEFAPCLPDRLTWLPPSKLTQTALLPNRTLYCAGVADAFGFCCRLFFGTPSSPYSQS
ncbi:hypothetical protein D3C75_197590 [compost metagenome]